MLEALVVKATGEILVVKPKGWPWGKKECDGKVFVIKELDGIEARQGEYQFREPVYNMRPDGTFYKSGKMLTKRVKATAVSSVSTKVTNDDLEVGGVIQRTS